MEIESCILDAYTRLTNYFVYPRILYIPLEARSAPFRKNFPTGPVRMFGKYF